MWLPQRRCYNPKPLVSNGHLTGCPYNDKHKRVCPAPLREHNAKQHHGKIVTGNVYRWSMAHCIRGLILHNVTSHAPPPARHAPIDFAIVGLQKGGTTALRWHLQSNKQHICVSENEFHLELFKLSNLTRAHISNCSKCGGARAGVLLGVFDPILIMGTPHSLTTLHEWAPALKVIVLLREPIFRAYSAWRMRYASRPSNQSHGERFNASVATSLRMIRNGNTTLRQSRRQCVVFRGFHHHQLLNLAVHFPRPKQMLIAVSERALANTLGEYTRIFTFLNISALSLTLRTTAKPVKVQVSTDPGQSILKEAACNLYGVYNASTEGVYNFQSERIPEWEHWYAAYVGPQQCSGYNRLSTGAL